MKEMYRQGDLLFIRIDKLPNDLIKQNSKEIIKSSVTGHSHKVKKGIVYINSDVNWDNRGNFYLELLEDDKIIHEEHKSLELPQGLYEVRRQREVNGYVRD